MSKLMMPEVEQRLVLTPGSYGWQGASGLTTSALILEDDVTDTFTVITHLTFYFSFLSLSHLSQCLRQGVGVGPWRLTMPEQAVSLHQGC